MKYYTQATEGHLLSAEFSGEASSHSSNGITVAWRVKTWTKKDMLLEYLDLIPLTR
jgi:hypothetical protein